MPLYCRTVKNRMRRTNINFLAPFLSSNFEASQIVPAVSIISSNIIQILSATSPITCEAIASLCLSRRYQ